MSVRQLFCCWMKALARTQRIASVTGMHVVLLAQLENASTRNDYSLKIKKLCLATG